MFAQKASDGVCPKFMNILQCHGNVAAMYKLPDVVTLAADKLASIQSVPFGTEKDSAVSSISEKTKGRSQCDSAPSL